MPKSVGEKEYKYRTEKISVEYNGISLYGKALIPVGESGQKFKTVIYAHGANSNYKSDMTTLKSLAGSGIACYFNPRPPWGGRLQKYTNMQHCVCT